MTEDTMLDIPPPPDQRIRHLYVWITVDSLDQSEGIMSYDMPFQFGTRHAPLMSSKRDVAENLRPVAEHVAAMATEERGHTIAAVLRTFWS